MVINLFNERRAKASAELMHTSVANDSPASETRENPLSGMVAVITQLG
jgi:hypothetical protein